jgi:hypothetical protein
MDSLRYLLAAIAALTLIMSVVSTVNPGYFAGLNAFADHDDEEDDDNSGSSNDDSEEEEHEDDEHDEKDDDSDEDDDDDKNRGKDREDNDEDELVQTLGNNSKATLKIDDDVELEVEIEDGDLNDGTYGVMFACDSPDVDEEFADALEVEDGEGEFEQDLPLTNGTYSGCEVEVGGLSATFSSFMVAANDDDEEDEDEREEDDDDKREREKERERDLKKEFKLKADENGAEIEIEVEGLNMTDGTYDAVFSCEAPAFNVTLDNAFEVEDGEGKLEETIGLANGTYSSCEIAVQGAVLASFNTFTVSEESEDEQKQKVEENRKEKRIKIATTINGTTIHEKHRGQNASSPGEYESGLSYILSANGTAVHDVHNGTDDHEAEVEIDVDLAVWKSNRAIILLDVLGGTVEVENQTYTVVLGYALYSIQHDVFKLGALAIDGDGEVFRLKMSGNAVGDDAEFPMESGSLELEFEGTRGTPDRLGDWELAMDGTITVG